MITGGNRKLIAFACFFIVISIALFVGKFSESGYIEFGKWLFVAFVGANTVEHLLNSKNGKNE